MIEQPPRDPTKPRYNGKHPGGRPPKYRADVHPQSLIEAAEQGLSLTAWCGTMEVERTVIIEWSEQYSEFARAVEIAKAKRLRFFETKAVAMMSSEGLARPTGGQATLALFMLKNHGPDEFKDRQEVTHNVGITIEQLLVKADEQRLEPKDVTPSNVGAHVGTAAALPKPDK